MSERIWDHREAELSSLRGEAVRLLDELIAWWPGKRVESVGIAGGTLHLDLLRDSFAGEGPFVVLNPEDREQIQALTKVYENTTGGVTHTPRNDYVDAMQAALRDLANPAPPKPDEPTGLGAVVVDREGVKWVRTFLLYGTGWVPSDENTGRASWADIDVVDILSQGVEA